MVYKSETQTLTACSSTEAERVASVTWNTNLSRGSTNGSGESYGYLGRSFSCCDLGLVNLMPQCLVLLRYFATPFK